MNIEQSFIKDIKVIIEGARDKAYAAVNFSMVEAYWYVGRRIVEEEQKGEIGRFMAVNCCNNYLNN